MARSGGFRAHQYVKSVARPSKACEPGSAYTVAKKARSTVYAKTFDLYNAISKVPSNTRLQLTPLRGPEIVRILKTDFRSTVIPTYRCGATEAQPVGRASCRSRLIL